VKAHVTLGDRARDVDVKAGTPVRIPLPNELDTVDVEAAAPGVFARVERRFLRPWGTPPPAGDTALRLLVRWPEARVGDAAPVRVVVSKEGRGKRLVDVRVHLPPGAHLAAPVGAVREVQGQLLWRTAVGDQE